MATVDKQRFREIVEQIFNRWTALKMCVEHGMGGRNSHQTAIEIMNYTLDYCTFNEGCTQHEIQEFLSDIMDEEFETLCEDNSIEEISAHLVRYLQLCRELKYDQIAQELAQLPPTAQWLTPQFKVQYVPRQDDSSSDDDDGESGSDDAMDDGEQAAVAPKNNRRAPRSNNGGQMDTEEDDGWTTVPSRRRN